MLKNHPHDLEKTLYSFDLLSDFIDQGRQQRARWTQYAGCDSFREVGSPDNNDLISPSALRLL